MIEAFAFAPILFASRDITRKTASVAISLIRPQIIIGP